MNHKLIIQQTLPRRIQQARSVCIRRRIALTFPITASVEKSLKRLQMDHIDVLLLHRLDPLVELEEVARAFDELKSAGKVSWFGVSNHTAAQMDLLRKYLNQPIVANQVEFNVIHTHMLDEGIIFNQNNPRPTPNEDTIEYCRQYDITLQAWAPLANGWVTGHPRENAPKHFLQLLNL